MSELFPTKTIAIEVLGCTDATRDEILSKFVVELKYSKRKGGGKMK